MSVAALAIGVRQRRFRRSQAAAATGCIGLLAVDLALLGAMVVLIPAPCWPLLLAAPASTMRIVYTADALRLMLPR